MYQLEDTNQVANINTYTMRKKYKITAKNRAFKHFRLAVRSRKRKRNFRKRCQGVSKREIGYYHFRLYSTQADYYDLQQKIFDREFGDYEKINAPINFSIVENPEEFIGFVNSIRSNLDKGKKVFVNLGRLECMTDDALVILLSNMIKFQDKGIPFNGNYPRKSEYRRKIKQSGFMEYLSKKTPDGIALNNINSAIYTHGKNRVISTIASQLIAASSNTVWGKEKRCPGVMNTFTELMANTYKHASPEEGKHHWWVSVTKDKVNKKVTFSFVDYGVGIFRSLKSKKADDQLYNALEKLWYKFPWADNNAKMMKLILQGELHKTVTRQPNRGKGLPYIYECMKRNYIDSLVIISNNVYVDVKNDVYKLLDNEFIGTFVTWEMNPSIFNI